MSFKSFFLVNDTASEMQVGSILVSNYLRFFLQRFGLEYRGSITRHELEARNYAVKLQQLTSDTLVVINGEGSLYGGSSAVSAISDIVSLIKRDRRMSIILLNSSIQSLNQELINILTKCDLVTVRDDQSQMRLAAVGVEAQVLADISMIAISDDDFISAKLPEMGEVKNKTAVFKQCFFDSADQAVSISLFRASQDKRCDYLSLICPDGNHLRFDSLGPRLRLLYLQLRVIIRKIQAFVGFGKSEGVSKFVGATFSLREFFLKFGEFSCTVTGRYHAACIAMSLGKPFILLPSLTTKNQDLVLTYGLDARRFVTLVDDVDSEVLLSFSVEETENIERIVRNSRSIMDSIFSHFLSLDN